MKITRVPIFFNKLLTLISFLILGLSSFAVSAQKIDSLKSLLPSSKGVDRYEILFSLAYEYSDVNDSLSLIYADQLFSLAIQMGDSNRITKAGRIKAGELRRLERLNEAVQEAEHALKIARTQNNSSEIKLLLNSLAVSHTHMAEYDIALKYNFESLIIREAEGNKPDISIALNNIGVIYYRLTDYIKALEYYQRSLQIKREVNDNHDLDRLLINIGLCHNYLGNHKEAKRYFDEGLEDCKEGCSDQIKLEGQIGLGISYFEMGNHQEALQHFQQSYAFSKKIGNVRFQAENLVYLAKLSILSKDFNEAAIMLHEVEKLSSEKGYNLLLIQAYETFSNLYKQTEDYINTSLYQSKYIALKDSIYNENLIKNLASVETDYEERENIKTIAEKDEVLKLNQEIINRQRQQYIFIFFITLLILGLAIALMWAGKLQRNANRQLADSRANLARKVNERTAELLRANKELDHFIYKTSHDIRGPLATFKGLCLIALADIKDPVGLDLVKKLDLTADKMNTILTRLLIVNQINTAELKPELIDFKTCIDEIMILERKKGLPARMVINHHVASDVELRSDRNLVRIVLENLIDNSIKFCDQSIRVDPFVDIRITRESKWILFTVVDNGIGINEDSKQHIFQMFVRASERSEIGGIGLYLSRLATEKLGGTIELISMKEKLTCFCVRIPIDLEPVLKSREDEKNIKATGEGKDPKNAYQYT